MPIKPPPPEYDGDCAVTARAVIRVLAFILGGAAAVFGAGVLFGQGGAALMAGIILMVYARAPR